MTLKRLGALAGALYALSFQLHAAQPRNGELDTLIEAAVAQSGVPGLSVAVIRPDQPDYIKGFGRRSVESSARVDERTIFKVNSITKSMTSTAAATLVDEGVLRWDDRIIDHYPEFRLSDPWITRETRFEDVFSHRVGVEATDWMEDIPHLTLQEAVHNMRYLPQQKSFRTEMLYDNFMYSVGGLAAGRLTNGWDRLIEERLFELLGMKDATVRFQDYIEPAEVAACHECEVDHAPRGLNALRKPVNIAAPHIYIDSEARLTHWRWSSSRPAGGVWASARDIARYLKLYLGAGEIGGVRVLSRESMAQLTTPRIHMDPESPVERAQAEDEFTLRKSQSPTGYALGWTVGDYMGHATIQHTGSSIGYNSFVIILPEAGLAAAITANMRDGAPAVVKPVAMSIVDMLLGLEPVPWLDKSIEAHEKKQASSEKRAQDALAQTVYEAAPLPVHAYTGRYRHAAYGDIVIEPRAGDAFLLRQGEQRWGVMHHMQNNVFQMTWNGVRPEVIEVDFDIGADGRAHRLTLDGQTFLRHEPPGE